MARSGIPIVPGIEYDPADQTVYVDVATFANWVGVNPSGQVQDSLLLAAVRCVRGTEGTGTVRAYHIRGGSR